ncbi:ABC transporter ATP-binding protein [Pacificibacter marinus]|uniref:ABC transporter ATP-binding protein n=1 Tax=Pacificibacter marinus TaxID=658057 RepID=UPI001C077177|nr:ABC transporter ATP-binding protein [Pacificibacter marinus]MBU2867274.1 ABC transporter ATP-binding protein [Pacificibacter marinus]
MTDKRIDQTPVSEIGPPKVEAWAVNKVFGYGDSSVQAVSDVELTLEPGTTTALVGPSGCGKSTLLRMVAGLETPTSGAIRIGGEEPHVVARKGRLSVAFQDPSLLPWRTAASNVALARRLAGLPKDPEKVQHLLSLVGLDGFENKRPAELSGGMRQRCAIARCLATDARLLLLDEPFGAVDEMTRRRLNLELPRVWEGQGTTTLLVTHSVTEAVLLSDRVIVMSHRPARVSADIAIDIERPRRASHLTSPKFLALVTQINTALGIIDEPEDDASRLEARA